MVTESPLAYPWLVNATVARPVVELKVIVAYLAESARYQSVAVTPLRSSSVSVALTVTVSMELGTTGKWETFSIKGAVSVASTELAAPGVPPSGTLAVQFSPYWLGKLGSISSSDLPPASAPVVYSQPFHQVGWLVG